MFRMALALTLSLVVFLCTASAQVWPPPLPCQPTFYYAPRDPCSPDHSAWLGWQAQAARQGVIYSVNGGSYASIPLYFDRAVNYYGKFEAADNRGDLDQLVTNAAGIRPTGDIELMILDNWNYRQFERGGQYAALYSTNRSASGDYAVFLQPGNYRLVINNRHSLFAQKAVRLYDTGFREFR